MYERALQFCFVLYILLKFSLFNMMTVIVLILIVVIILLVSTMIALGLGKGDKNSRVTTW